MLEAGTTELESAWVLRCVHSCKRMRECRAQVLREFLRRVVRVRGAVRGSVARMKRAAQAGLPLPALESL